MNFRDMLRMKHLLGTGGGNTSGGNAGAGTAEEWIGDGNTHIWITLPEGRTTPMMGMRLLFDSDGNYGKVEVDWGDGSAPDVLSGSLSEDIKWTPTHNYAKPGSYVITLTVKQGILGLEGVTGSRQYSQILRHSIGANVLNCAYLDCVQRVEIGNKVEIRQYAFSYCTFLKSVKIPDNVTVIGMQAFRNCYALTDIRIPNGVTNIGNYTFYSCCSLTSIVIPSSVTSIGEYAFGYCYGMRSYDLSSCGSPPTLSNVNAFYGIPDDCEILVDTNVVIDFASDTNWAELSDYFYEA